MKYVQFDLLVSLQKVTYGIDVIGVAITTWK